MKAVDEYFAELEPLVNRPLSRMQLEEQPLPSEWPTVVDAIAVLSADTLNDLPDDVSG